MGRFRWGCKVGYFNMKVLGFGKWLGSEKIGDMEGKEIIFEYRDRRCVGVEIYVNINFWGWGVKN